MAVDYAVITEAPRFTVGRVLRSSIGVLWRNLWCFAVIAVFVVGPYTVWSAWNDAHRRADFTIFTATIGAFIVFINVLAYALMQTAVVEGTLRDLDSDPATIRDCFEGAFASLPVLARVNLIALLPTWCTMPIMVMLGYRVPSLQAWAGVVDMVLILLGWWIVVPPVVAERAGPFGALRRGWALMSRRRWRIFGILTATVIGGLGLSFGLDSMLSILWHFTALTGPFVDDINTSSEISCFMIFFATVSAATYHHLRLAQEGVPAAKIAKVFD